MPQSRKEALLIGAKYYHTGKECKYGHTGERYTSDRSCTICAVKRASGRYLANAESIKKSLRERYAATPEKIKARVNKRRELHPEKVKLEKKAEYQKHKQGYIDKAEKWRLANPEKVKKIAQKWNRNNPVAAYQHTVNRRTRLTKRTPLWLTDSDRKTIKQMYQKAYKISLTTGIKHHVDHIVPLRGVNVSGLHVPWNLQVLTAVENQSKGNKLILREGRLCQQ